MTNGRSGSHDNPGNAGEADRKKLYRDVIFNEAVKRAGERKFDDAENLLRSLLPGGGSTREDEEHLRLAFAEPFEELLYKHKFKPAKRIAPHPEAEVRTFLTYGYVLMERQNFDEALKVLEGGLQYNPVHVALLFEEAEIFKIKKDWTAFRKTTDMCREYAFKSQDMARVYRNYGYMFAGQEDYEAAICCYLLSTWYEQHVHAQNQLQQISRTLNKKIDEELYRELIPEVLKEREIGIGPSGEILNLAYSFATRCEEDKDYRAACYFYAICQDLTQDSRIEVKLGELQQLFSRDDQG